LRAAFHTKEEGRGEGGKKIQKQERLMGVLVENERDFLKKATVQIHVSNSRKKKRDSELRHGKGAQPGKRPLLKKNPPSDNFQKKGSKEGGEKRRRVKKKKILDTVHRPQVRVTQKQRALEGGEP